jgi:hypothetical protein
MATYTITTGTAGAPVDYAALGTRAAGDVYNINGGYLKVDVDTRYGLGGVAAAQISNTTMSASLGGSILFDSRFVRCIPFTGGSGNVPAADTVISIGGASGKLIGVYSALNAAPTAAAAAMPATGFIKIRAWNSVSYTAGVLTGIAATGAIDGPGWLEIVGLDAASVTVNRLNQFLVRGDYYTFQGITTDGTRATTYQLPTNGSAVVYCPGVEVESVVPGVYDFYPCAGSKTALAANIATDLVRGKWCWISTAGLVRFGHDGTNSTGGYIPPAGRKVRVPNIFFVCSVAASSVNVIPNATPATRYEFLTTGGGVVDIDKASCNWYLNFLQPYSIKLTNTNTFEQIQLLECATAIEWSNVGVGQTAAVTLNALIAALNFAGGTMDKCTWTRSALATAAVVNSWTDCAGFTVTNERVHSLTKIAASGGGSITKNRVVNSTWQNSTLGGGQVWLTTCTDVSYKDTIYYDHPATTTGTSIPLYAFSVATNCLRCTFDGLSFGGLFGVQPYSGILNILAAGCAEIKLRNLGTAAVPLDMGGPEVAGTWTQATTVASITKVAHGLKVNDIIYVLRASNTSVMPVGAKTVTGVTSADVFTFTVGNASTTGTLTYYLTMASALVALAAGAAANNVKVQRCYVPHLRGALIAGDNSSKAIVYESVRGDNVQGFSANTLITTYKMLTATPALTAQTSVYGTHWLDTYTTDGVITAGATYTQVTTTATITSSGHGLRTGDFINVTVTSNNAIIVLGQKTITVLTSNTFTFACLTGSTTGSITYTPLNGLVAIQMNEPTAETASQVTLINGSAFTSAGSLYMPVIGQQADFTCPYSIRGHGAFPIAEAVMAGGTIANYGITYSLDSGATYSNLYYPRPGGGGASASTNVTMTDTTGVAVGDYVWGTNIAPNAKVVSITNGTTVVVNIANIGTVSGILRFNHLPSETVASSATGFSLKLRIKTSITNATAITSVYFYTYATSTDRSVTYPMDTNTVTFTGLPTGCDAVTLVAGANTILDSQDSMAGTSYSFTYSGAQNIDVGFIKPGYVPQYIRGLSLTTSDSSIPVALTVDRNFI